MARRKPFPDRKDRHTGGDRKPRRGGSAGGGQGWLYGLHPVLAALDNPRRQVQRLVAAEESRRALEPRLAPYADRLQPEWIGRADLDMLLPPGAVHQGVALLAAPLESLDVTDLPPLAEARGGGVVLALDQVTDPHNVGAILRSAAAFGALAVLTQDRHAPEESGSLAKSASGAMERVPLVRVTNLVRALDTLKESGFWVAGLAADGPVSIGRFESPERLVLVLGSEGEGLRRLTAEHCDHLLRLPMSGAMESLNVSNAAAVALYAVLKDRLEESQA